MSKSSWGLINKILVGFKKFPLFKLLYRISWAPSVYHYTLSLLGALIYRFPSRKIIVIGVTGTKGKTTTTELINTILESAGKKTALASSIRFKLGDKNEPNKTGNTQPGRFFIQYFLREAVNNGCQYAILEVGSEGVVMHRHRFINFDVAVFTGIHPEHIESHGSFENYLRAKLTFFKYVKRRSGKKQKHFVINGEDKYSERFVEAAGDNPVSLYSVYDGELKLIGDFNRRNAAAAEAACRALGVEDKVIEKALGNFAGVEGRMEFVQKEPFAVVVDYAHTPVSLEAVYETLNKDLSGRLICVLGSMGGGRDKWKRPEFGRIASEHCAEVIITNEDPVDEKPEAIMADIKAGAIEGRAHVQEIVDRKEAIRAAISMAHPGDVVAITGKGREPYIRVAKGKRIPWSDVEAAQEVLKGEKH